ncbi:hypothetical protein EGW08_004779 [Elysia chlorotica]|uniref:Uncharacterized protein n=1 Tax=Elysia chlorotica TaxID=188477 RepID=A0A3S0ZV36_ELYCH|nr:hypothetical protein EGW08_004779 [Elysia chlorotica]
MNAMERHPIPTIVLHPDSAGMTESKHIRRGSSPLLGTCLPPPIMEDEEDEEVKEASKASPPSTLPVPSSSSSSSSSITRQDLCSPQFLCVDESKRPRAHSDPSVSVGGLANYILPEITVTEDDGGGDNAHPVGGPRGSSHQLSLKEPHELARKRSNTCPEDLFRPNRKGRPATPPPTDVVPLLGGKRRSHSTAGPRRFSFNFAPPPVTLKSPTSVSFAHHKLSKVSEDAGTETIASAAASTKSRTEVDKSSTPQIIQQMPLRNINQSITCGTETGRSGSTRRYMDSNNRSGDENHLESRLATNGNDSNIPQTSLPSTRILASASTDRTCPSLKYMKDRSSSEKAASQNGTTAARLNESLRTLSVTERRLCDPSDASSKENASGIPRDSLAAWRAGDKGDAGHLTAV